MRPLWLHSAALTARHHAPLQLHRPPPTRHHAPLQLHRPPPARHHAPLQRHRPPPARHHAPLQPHHPQTCTIATLQGRVAVHALMQHALLHSAFLTHVHGCIRGGWGGGIHGLLSVMQRQVWWWRVDVLRVCNIITKNVCIFSMVLYTETLHLIR